MSITSLAATTYLLHVLPAGETGIAPLDAWTRADDVAAAAADAAKTLAAQGRGLGRRPPADLFRRRPDPSAGKSPLELYLPYLNAALALVLVFMGYVHGRTSISSSFAWIGIGNLPAMVYVIVLAAKVVMGAVDPEKELAELKYSYKGA